MEPRFTPNAGMLGRERVMEAPSGDQEAPAVRADPEP